MAMVRHGSIVPGAVVRQPGARWLIEENGITRRYETYRCNAADLLQLMPVRGAAHPVYSDLTVKRIEPRELELEMAEFTIEYSGVAGSDAAIGSGSDDLPEPVYSLRRSQTTEPITTHPKWNDIVAAADVAHVKYDESGIFMGFSKDALDKSLVGVTDYLTFGAIFVKSYVSRKIPSLAAVGFIDNPPDEAPDVQAGFDWLKIDASFEKEGKVYAITEAWMLSGRNGWHPIIYGDD